MEVVRRKGMGYLGVQTIFMLFTEASLFCQARAKYSQCHQGPLQLVPSDAQAKLCGCNLGVLLCGNPLLMSSWVSTTVCEPCCVWSSVIAFSGSEALTQITSDDQTVAGSSFRSPGPSLFSLLGENNVAYS